MQNKPKSLFLEPHTSPDKASFSGFGKGSSQIRLALGARDFSFLLELSLVQPDPGLLLAQSNEVVAVIPICRSSQKQGRDTQTHNFCRGRA